MVARVPTPGSTGLGSAPLAEIRTPYSNIKAPKEAFGDGGKLFAQLSEGAAGASDEMTKLALDADDRAVKAAEAEVDTLLAGETQKFKGMKGQQRLDALNPKGHPGQVDQGDKATVAAEGQIEAILKKHGVQTTDGAKAIRDMARIKGMEHTITLNGLQIEAQKEADITEQGTAVAAHTQAASAAIGTEMQGQKLQDSLDGIASIVKSKRFGMAKTSGITDPAAIDRLVKQQQSVMLDQYIGDLLAQGKVEDARLIMQEHAGTLDGTEAGRKHQAAVLGFEQEQASRAELDALRRETGDDLVKMYDTVYTKYKDDPVKQGRMLEQVRLYAGIKSAQISETVRQASQDVSDLLAQGVPPNDPRVMSRLAVVASSSPQALITMLGLPSRFAAAGAQSAETQAHVANGGAPASVVAAKRAYDKMATERPDQLAKIASTPEGLATLRRVLDEGDYNDILTKVDEHNEKVLAMREGTGRGYSEYRIDDILKGFGFKPSDKYYARLSIDPELRKSINQVRADILEKTGKAAQDADLIPIVAEHVLRLDDYDTGVKTGPLGFFTHKDAGPYTLSVAEDKGVAISDLPLRSPTRGTNNKTLQLYFGVTETQLHAAIDKLESQNRSVTLQNLKTVGGLTMKQGGTYSDALRGYTAAQDAALANGYSPEVIEFAIKRLQVNQPTIQPDVKGFNWVMREFATKSNLYENTLRQFMSEGR